MGAFATYVGAGDGAYESTLTVGHMADRANVDRGLARDDLGVQGRDLRCIE